MNFEKARFNMVEQQVRPWDVLDPKVLDLMSQLPREDFTPQPFRKLAYADTNIEVDARLLMLTPRECGRAIQALAVKPSERVLEIGTGTGYLTALLAQCADHVVSVEQHADIQLIAKENLQKAEIKNISFKQGYITDDWQANGPYDVICVNGSLAEIPSKLQSLLKIGGRLFVVLGNEPNMQAMLYRRFSSTQWQSRALYETVVPRLNNHKTQPSFEF